MKVTVVLLTWKRIAHLKRTLLMLSGQTYQDFDVHITNGNLQHFQVVDRVAKSFAHRLNIKVTHDGNDIYAFRRFAIGKKLAEQGTDVILFIDDDVAFPSTYVENALNHYEPKTYQSGFTWYFYNGGKDYYKYRRKVFDNDHKIHYCGTGVGMIDATIFLEKKLFDAPPAAYFIEDLWLSYFAQHVMKWKLKHFPIPNVLIGGTDNVALWKEIVKNKKIDETRMDKADFLRMLVKKYHWKL
jgi:glycosyltransferase involved in cell wall biosynthesis